MNNQEKGYVCWMVSFILIISIHVILYLFGITSQFAGRIPIGDYGHNLLLEKYMFYGVIISALIGNTYIYGNPEKDFNKHVALPATALFIIMDLQAVFNLLEILIV